MTAGSTQLIRLAEPAEAARVGSTICEAFTDDPINHWVVPEVADWPKVLDPFFGVVAEEAASGAGTVYVRGDYDAVAVWFDVTEPEPELPAEPSAEMAQLCGRYADRFHFLLGTMHHAEPDASHHRLEFVAVRKELRGKGIGAELIEAHHARLDEQGLGSYLNASNWDSHRFYLQHGYRVLDSGPVQLPDGPTFWPMWRDPVTA